MKLSYKLYLALFSVLLISGCATRGGKFEPESVYNNASISNKESIATNVVNYITLPRAYMPAIRNTIKEELSKNNKTIAMSSIAELDPDYKKYVTASRKDQKSLPRVRNIETSLFLMIRQMEESYQKGLEMMLEDGKGFDKYPLSLALRFKNTTDYKSVPLAFVSAITVFAIPVVKEHTLTVDAVYYDNDKKIGEYTKTVDYDFVYGWGVDKHDNLHTDQVRNLINAVLSDLKNKTTIADSIE